MTDLDKALGRLMRAMVIAQYAFNRDTVSAAMVDIQINPIITHAVHVKKLLASTPDEATVTINRTDIIGPATAELLAQSPDIPDTVPEDWKE